MVAHRSKKPKIKITLYLLNSNKTEHAVHSHAAPGKAIVEALLCNANAKQC